MKKVKIIGLATFYETSDADLVVEMLKRKIAACDTGILTNKVNNNFQKKREILLDNGDAISSYHVIFKKI